MTDTNPPPEWKIPLDALMSDDPLLRCLVIMTRLYQRPFSAQTLTAGLPLENGHLTPELFLRADHRAGLTGRVTKRNLLDISTMTFPVVLLLKNGNACVATTRNEANVWTVIQPESDGGAVQISTEELSKFYNGFVIFCRPSFHFDSRAHEHIIPESRHWF